MQDDVDRRLSSCIRASGQRQTPIRDIMFIGRSDSRACFRANFVRLASPSRLVHRSLKIHFAFTRFTLSWPRVFRDFTPFPPPCVRSLHRFITSPFPPASLALLTSISFSVFVPFRSAATLPHFLRLFSLTPSHFIFFQPSSARLSPLLPFSRLLSSCLLLSLANSSQSFTHTYPYRRKSDMIASVVRLTSLFAILVVSVVASSESPAFAANLAASKRDAAPLAIKRSTVNLNTPRLESRSDQLKRMLSDALVALHALPSPSATTTSPAATSSTAAPSASASIAARKRMARNLDAVKKAIAAEPWESLDSSLLCPGGETACPIFPRMGSYECIDTVSDLESCGGCSSRSEGEDCSAIPGAQGVTCDLGSCVVFTCQSGWKLETDYKGRERCRKQHKETLKA